MHLDDEIEDLYRQSRTAYLCGNNLLAEKLYRQLRADHGVELFYEVDLPEHIRFVHPLGAVLGRAFYGDYFVCYNGSGVGSDLDGNRPVLGSGICLFPGAKVLGKSVIGANVFIQANVVVNGVDVPDNSIVYENGIIRKTKRSVIDHFFKT